MRLKELICPISSLRVNESVVRGVAFAIALIAGLYAYTGNVYLILLLLVDFYIRAFTTLRYSPTSWLIGRVVQTLELPVVLIDKAPKLFAARVGFLFSVTILLLYFVHPLSSVVISLVLIIFALLEAVFNICVGCLVYSYVVFPLFGTKA
jgi:hypothetical protein